MKRLLAIVLVLVLVLASLSGCGKKEETAGPAAEPIVITYAHVEAEDTVLHQATVKFKEYVEAQSNGELQINILPNGQFGGDREATEAVAAGTIQMSNTVTAVLTSYSNDFMVLDLPFIFNSREACYAALDGELGAKLNDRLPEIGLINLGYADNGLRQLTNNVRPINTPADLKGVKMRVMESPVFIRMFELLGANPVPMSFTEVYTALQQGTVDGQENGAALIYQSKFPEVIKYMSVSNHVYSVNTNLINKAFYEGLTADQQKILADGAKQFLTDWQREQESAGDEEYTQKIADAGVAVNVISPEDLQKFRDAVAPMYDEYKAQVDPTLFDLIDKYNAQ